jgi:hypothetical protein
MFASLVPSAETETPLTNQITVPELTRITSAGTRDVEVAQQAHTRGLDVTAENRRLNWVETLLPLPAANALSVSFRAQGNWYSLSDTEGNGTLSASDPTIGAGTVDYVTGSLVITLGALPDAGSQIVITWASPVHYEVRAGATSAAGTACEMVLQAEKTPVAFGSVIVTWPYGAGTKTASADSAGNITGDATGSVDHITGEIRLRFANTAIPNRDGEMTLQYDWNDPNDPNDEYVKTITTTTSTTVVPETALTPGAVNMSIAVSQPDNSIGRFYNIRDNGTGSIVFKPGQDTYFMTTGSWGLLGNQTIGTVNYATGSVSINSTVNMRRRRWLNTAEWVDENATGTVIMSSGTPENQPQIVYTSTTVPVTAREETETTNVVDANLTLDVTATTSDFVVPNSVRFAFAGKSYDDRNGLLYTDIDPVTQVGLQAGTIDYSTGVCTLPTERTPVPLEYFTV